MKIDDIGKLFAKDLANYKADEDYELVITPDSPTSVLYCFDIWGSEYQFWVIQDVQKTILTKVVWSLEISKVTPQHEKDGRISIKLDEKAVRLILPVIILEANETILKLYDDYLHDRITFMELRDSLLPEILSKNIDGELF